MSRRSRKVAEIQPQSCVAEVMGTELFTLTPDTGVAAALRLASNKRISHFLVIEEGNLTGVVCQSDLQQARKETMVVDCMSTPVLCISPETTIEEAAGIMQENAVGCLPVVTGTFLVGMVTRDEVGDAAPSDDDDDDDDLAAVEEKAVPTIDRCASCGKKKKVKRDMRFSLAPMCDACAKAVPANDVPRGN